MSNAAKLLKDQLHLIPSNSPVPNRRILVVDDEPEIAQGIQRILCPKDSNIVSIQSSRKINNNTVTNKNEFEVVICNTPMDALKELKESIKNDKPFAMGFFDVMLGAEIDGIELVKQVMDLDSRLFAVFVTAYHDRSVDTIGKFLGEESRERWDYINKPFSEGEILQKARNATSLWDLNRLKEWQAERLSEAHQLLMNSERQNAVAAISRSVAHEFGNLLTHIIGHAEIAQLSNNLSDVKNSIEIILKAGNTAASVLKNFRSLNENEVKQSEFKVYTIHNIIDEALELMEFRFKRHNIKIIKNYQDSLSGELNKNSLIQVFANLFINAIHAMPKGGDIKIETLEKNDQLIINIIDSGSGISPEFINKVTEPLFTTKGSQGSGLGLAISKEIIEIEHRGQFKIDNHNSGGVIVSLMIPQIKEN
jgi:signal transduction histidine kinase